MRHITVESPVGDRLGDSTEQVIVCDVEGRVIGFFSPLRGRPRLEDLRLEPPRSIAQTEELRQKQRTGKPLEEILGRLGI
jgi:hypothetical protein